jgi:hypothetical protein
MEHQHLPGMTKLVFDVLVEFSNGFSNTAELLVSTMFSKMGVYHIIGDKSSTHNIVSNMSLIHEVQGCYIWYDLHDVSDMLRSSFLYDTLYDASRYLTWMNDENFNDSMKQFKSDVVQFIHNHAMFLSYCDVERTGLFLYSNGHQALQKGEFIDYYDLAIIDLNNLYNRVSNRLPKIVFSILDRIRKIIDIREILSESLIIDPCVTNIPKFPYYSPETFNLVVTTIERSNLTALHHSLEFLYNQLIPIHIMSCFKWMISIQGEIEDSSDKQSIEQFITTERLLLLMELESTLTDPETPCMRKQLAKLPFIFCSFKLLKDENFIKQFTLQNLGYHSEIIIGNAMKLYFKNIKLLVWADILFVGYYDILDKKLLPRHADIGKIVKKAKHDMDTYNEMMVAPYMDKISQRALRTFATSLKKVERFYKRLTSMQSKEDASNGLILSNAMDLLFGEVYDKDNNPVVCPICFDDCEEKKDTWWLLKPCNHLLHLECFNALCNAKHDKCPLCRNEIY